MTTPENQPPWNPPPGYPPPSAYPPAPGGYPPAPQGYPPAPGSYPPAPQGYPPAPGGYPQAPSAYPPAPPQGYEPPTTRYPPYEGPIPPGGGTPFPPAPKTSGAGRIAGIVGGLLVVALVIGLKFGAASFLSGLFEEEAAGPRDAWEGTAAATFSSGEDALVLPTAAAEGVFTEAEVAEALDTVRRALVAGRLDEKMLVDHDTSTFEALFSEGGREDLYALVDDQQASTVLTWIAPGHTLIEDGVRFKGDITVSTDVLENGIPVIIVESNFVWVYAFTGELRETGDHLVTVHDRIKWAFPKAEEVADEFIGMFLFEAQSSASNIDCDLFEQDYIALGQPVYADVDVDPDDAFDPDGSMEVPEELAC